MSEIITTTSHGDFDSVFHEVALPEPVALTSGGQLRLFHMKLRSGKFTPSEMKAILYRNIGEYVFSRARLEKFKLDGDAFSVGAQAIRILNKGGGPDIKGSGAELGEMLLYSFLEQKLNAPKLMSRVELSTDAKQYNSVCDSIHLLTSGTSGLPYHQVVFGTSNIVGDLAYAIDGAFESILRIENNEDNELHMVDSLILDRLATDEEIELARSIFLPSPEASAPYNTSYGVFLGYTLGLNAANYPLGQYPAIVEEKMQADIQHNVDYILAKIRDNNLGMHSFYFYILPFDDAEDEKKSIMEAVLKGEVDL